MSGFNYYHEFYGHYIGVTIHGAIGKKYIYRKHYRKQEKYPYQIPTNKNTPEQQRLRKLFGDAVRIWQGFSASQRRFYRSTKPKHLVMTGFNYFISLYMRTY